MKYLLFIITLVTISHSINGQDFKEDNKAYRKKLNKEFKDPKESPLTPNDFKTFKELDFFNLDESFRVSATLVINTSPQFFKMATSTDRLPLYSTFGELIFTLKEQEYSLQVYQNQKLKNVIGYEDYLFVPFTDVTNGDETYGGGRYLDIQIPTSDVIFIDFNKAYNPYCAYSDRYSCPKVPAVNDLPIRIEAGVKNWEH